MTTLSGDKSLVFQLWGNHGNQCYFIWSTKTTGYINYATKNILLFNIFQNLKCFKNENLKNNSKKIEKIPVWTYLKYGHINSFNDSATHTQ